jgi:hypothetical protein
MFNKRTISKLIYIQQTYASQNVALQITCFTQAHKKVKNTKHHIYYNAITLIKVTQVVTNGMFCMFLGQYIY